VAAAIVFPVWRRSCKVEARKIRGVACIDPDVAEVRAAKPTAPAAGRRPDRLRQGLRIGPQMPPQLRSDLPWIGHSAAACPRFGLVFDQPSVIHLNQRPGDPHLTGAQVNVATTQSGQLTEPETGEVRRRSVPLAAASSSGAASVMNCVTM